MCAPRKSGGFPDQNDVGLFLRLQRRDCLRIALSTACAFGDDNVEEELADMRDLNRLMIRPCSVFGAMVCLCLTGAALPVFSAGYQELVAKRPELFEPDTGLRIARQRAPTPDDIPGSAVPVSPEQARALLTAGALAIDVFGAAQSRYDELDGTWLVSTPRESLPGAIWLPETGRGTLTGEMQGYLASNLMRFTSGDKTRALLVFCVADCWMSWNAAQRIAGLGYENVYWFRLGTDGWLDIGGSLEVVDPVPVNVD